LTAASPDLCQQKTVEVIESYEEVVPRRNISLGEKTNDATVDNSWFLESLEFPKKRHELKQVPMLYVLMSRRTAADYKAVLLHIRLKIFQDDFSVEEVVCDFEKAVWRTVQVS